MAVRRKNTMIQLGESPLCIADVGRISFDNQRVFLSPRSLKKAYANHVFLKKYAESNIVYGLNTGFGPMSDMYIGERNRIRLQSNLIRSHAVGQGQLIPDIYVRAIMAIRLQSLLQGYSGVHEGTFHILASVLNKNILPLVPEHGSVGASGDLVQLAHIALVLIGEGEVHFNGKKESASAVFKKEGITPLKIISREGLALMNGTAVMTGIGAINILRARALLHYAMLAAASLYEITHSPDDYFASELAAVRPHRGQKKVSQVFRKILKDSKLIARNRNIPLDAEAAGQDISRMPKGSQEVYSIRCAPQILGPILDTIETAEEIVETEMNSVTDNPVIVTDKKIIHGGNFHGDYVALEMDILKIAIVKLSVLSERRLNFLMNDKINRRLPPFLNRGVIGLDLGLQGLQFVATSTVAENQSLSVPVSVHSIPSNNDNQDVVSMGANAALLTKKVIANTFEVLAIELAAIARAVDILGIEGEMSTVTRNLYADIRKCAPLSQKDPDAIRRQDIGNIIRMMERNDDMPAE